MRKIESFLLVSFFCVFSVAGAAEINQSRIANVPIWSKLTPFESKTMNSLSAAKRGSSDALLRLFVFASGNLRQQKDFQKIKTKIDNFFEIYGNKINAQKNQWQKGFLLNRTMHQFFFSNSSENSSDAYEEDQSQFTEIFRTGKYNCVSSTALYLYLAQKLNLQVKAVILPTHTFVELELENGNKVDVETTSSTGFDWAHDRKFYKRAAKNWFSERKIAASTYTDYQNRKIVPAWELAALNMRNQHTKPSRMSLLNRIRLFETSLYLNEDDEQAWLSSLYVFNEIFIEYNNRHNLEYLVSLYDVSYSYVNNHMQQNSRYDTELFGVAQWYFSQAAYTYMQQGENDKAQQILLSHYSEAIQIKQTKPKILANNQIVFSGLLKSYIKSKEFSAAENLIDSVRVISALPIDWQQSVVWYYSERISPMWDDQDWKSIIDYWQQVKSRNLKTKELKIFIKNVSGAYQNYSIGYENKGNWRAAAEILLQCTENIPLDLFCSKKLDRLKSQHNIF